MSVVVTPDMPIVVSKHALSSVSSASRRLAEGDRSLSRHEFNAAAIINGRLEFLDDDFRELLILMGREWAHTVIEVMFEHWERETVLRPGDINYPRGDQRIFTRHAPEQRG